MSNRFDSMSRPNYPFLKVSSLISLSAFYLLISNFSLPAFICFIKMPAQGFSTELPHTTHEKKKKKGYYQEHVSNLIGP